MKLLTGAVFGFFCLSMVPIATQVFGESSKLLLVAQDPFAEEKKQERFKKVFENNILIPGSIDEFVFLESKKYDKNLVELAKQYAPILKMHPKEPYLPTSYNWFLKQVGLKYGKKVVKEPGSFQSAEDLLAHRYLPKNMNHKNEVGLIDTSNEDLQLFIPEKNQEKIRRGDFSQAKCYAYTHYLTENNQKYVQISYGFFYGFNGNPISRSRFLQFIYKKLKAGHHEADLEHITVRLKVPEQEKGKHSIAAIYYAAHADEGQWYKTQMANGLDGYQIQGTQPLVWSSLELHASYNRAGNIQRRQGFWGRSHLLPPDRTADGGPQLDCQKNLVVLPFDYYLDPQTYSWIFFNGRWGSKPHGKKSTDGPFGFTFKGYIHKEDPM